MVGGRPNGKIERVHAVYPMNCPLYRTLQTF